MPTAFPTIVKTIATMTESPTVVIFFPGHRTAMPTESSTVAISPGQIDADCDGNGTPDSCDLASGAGDCNANGLIDRLTRSQQPVVTAIMMDSWMHAGWSASRHSTVTTTLSWILVIWRVESLWTATTMQFPTSVNNCRILERLQLQWNPGRM